MWWSTIRSLVLSACLWSALLTIYGGLPVQHLIMCWALMGKDYTHTRIQQESVIVWIHTVDGKQCVLLKECPGASETRKQSSRHAVVEKNQERRQCSWQRATSLCDLQATVGWWESCAFSRTPKPEYKHTPNKIGINGNFQNFLFLFLMPAGRETVTGVTQHSGLIGVCLSLASLFWGSGWMGFVAVVLPEAWLGWFTGSVGTCAGDTPRAAWWGPKQPHCCCLHIWSLDWVALPSASLPSSLSASTSIHPSIPLPQLLRTPPPSPPLSTVCVAAGAPVKFKISSHFFLSPTHFPSPLSLASLSFLPSLQHIWWRTN